MGDKAINDIEVAPTSVVKQSARNFASVLVETSQFKSFEQAAERFRQDRAAQQTMKAFHFYCEYSSFLMMPLISIRFLNS
jgi:AICAR transformylase/IMP cyclohydrolase PurH